MPQSFSDVRSYPFDQIAHAAQVLGRSKQRLKIFKAIYHGKKRSKTVNEIATTTGLKRIRVLQEGKLLADNYIIKLIRAAGTIAYEKDSFYSANKKRIIRLVQDPVAFDSIPTSSRPHPVWPKNATIRLPRTRIQARYITIDEIDSFSRVEQVRVEPGRYMPMPEATFKRGVAKILKEGGHFSDWGGERYDLYTNKVSISGRRFLAAFAFKGIGTKGILTPGKMGKNGDQIQRLFKTPASVFIVQYWGQISDSVIDQMAEFAKAKSVSEGTLIYYGIINGDDSNRLVKAYPYAFRAKMAQTKLAKSQTPIQHSI
jgi:hypothetical protein